MTWALWHCGKKAVRPGPTLFSKLVKASDGGEPTPAPSEPQAASEEVLGAPGREIVGVYFSAHVSASGPKISMQQQGAVSLRRRYAGSCHSPQVACWLQATCMKLLPA
jgi:hypothetical protein